LNGGNDARLEKRGEITREEHRSQVLREYPDQAGRSLACAVYLDAEGDYSRYAIFIITNGKRERERERERGS